MILMDYSDDPTAEIKLTPRERQIVCLVALGRPSSFISAELGIARNTVERHVDNVRQKLRARNKAHVVSKALALGLCSFDHDVLAGERNIKRSA
jgi:DNA-binding CsgD family transcriptional regulator